MPEKILESYWSNGRIRLRSRYWGRQHESGLIQGFDEQGQPEFEVEIKNGKTIRRQLFSCPDLISRA